MYSVCLAQNPIVKIDERAHTPAQFGTDKFGASADAEYQLSPVLVHCGSALCGFVDQLCGSDDHLLRSAGKDVD